MKGHSNNKQDMNASPKAVLFAFMQELVSTAGKNGEVNIMARANRKLHRLMVACVDVAAKDLLHAVALELSLQLSLIVHTLVTLMAKKKDNYNHRTRYNRHQQQLVLLLPLRLLLPVRSPLFQDKMQRQQLNQSLMLMMTLQ